MTRIYHRASSMWIPVTLHPLFRKFAGEPAEPELPPLRNRVDVPARKGV